MGGMQIFVRNMKAFGLLLLTAGIINGTIWLTMKIIAPDAFESIFLTIVAFGIGVIISGAIVLVFFIREASRLILSQPDLRPEADALRIEARIDLNEGVEDAW